MRESIPHDDRRAGPLSGLLVADLSRVLAGPLVTMWLADLGATVVKVEHAGRGDDTRHWGPPWAATSSSYFTAANRSKHSLALDLTDPQDALTARQLTSRADIVVENFRTGRLTKYGLDYDSVAQTNPGVVYASITGFGSAEGRDVAGYDFVVQAVGGLMSITGSVDGEPTKAGVALVDVLTAKDATIGILAALRARDLHPTGHGQRVEVNLLSSLLGSLANQASSYLTTGNAPKQMGNQHPSIAPYETLRCRSGLLAVACGNDNQFSNLTRLLGIPAAATDDRFSTNGARVANRAALVPLLESALATRDADEWEDLCLQAGVPAGRVGTIADAFDLASRYGLDPVTPLPFPHPPQVAHPIRYSATRIRPAIPPPELGQASTTVRNWLASGAPISHLETALNEGTPR